MSLMAIRERMPFPLFIIVLAIVLILAGFACACLTDHPEQALDRALFAVAETSAPLTEVGFVIAALLSVSFLLPQAPTRARLQTFRL